MILILREGSLTMIDLDACLQTSHVNKIVGNETGIKEKQLALIVEKEQLGDFLLIV